MRENRNRIQQFEVLKKDLLMVQSGQEMKRLIDDFMAIFWKGYSNKDLFEKELTQLQSFHLYLIEAFQLCLRIDESEKNAHIVSEQLYVPSVLSEAEDSKSGHKMILIHNSKVQYIIGDLHSDDESLQNILETIGFYEKIYRKAPIQLIFLGDYVDRGKAHLKILERLMMLKILFPAQIFLLRGNHDGGILRADGELILPYGLPPDDDPMYYFPIYLKALIEKNPTVQISLLKAYLNLFDQLPYLAFIRKKDIVYTCVHGGLPRYKADGYGYLKVLMDLTQYPLLDHANASIVQNIMWSDPYRGEGDLKASFKRFYFTEAHYDAFKTQFGVDILLRGHECVVGGIYEHFNKTLFTIFSSGDSKDTYYSKIKPSIACIHREGQLEFIKIRGMTRRDNNQQDKQENNQYGK